MSLWNTVEGGSTMNACNLLTLLADVIVIKKVVAGNK